MLRSFSLLRTDVQRAMQNYDFGDSEIVDRYTFKKRICEMIKRLRDAGPLFLVFHDWHGDIKYVAEHNCHYHVLKLDNR